MARTKTTPKVRPGEEAAASIASNTANPNDQMQPSKAQQNKT